LECLLLGLKIMHACSEELSLSAHEACTSMDCCVGSANEIQDNMGRYVNELSQQLFKKKILRGDFSWWLPTFCSLVIQGFALRTIKASCTTEEELDFKYLHPAVRLFLAVSPKDMDNTDEELGKILLTFGLKTPAECLQDVFGMLDQPPKLPRVTNEPPTVPLQAALTHWLRSQNSKHSTGSVAQQPLSRRKSRLRTCFSKRSTREHPNDRLS
jgi:hypothetical protein